MRQNVARKQCTTTPQAIGKATRPSQEATRYPEGETSKTKNLLGQGATRMQPRGKGGKQPQNHKQTTKSPSAKGEANRKHRDETSRSRGTQASTERQTAKTHKSGSKQRAEQGTTQRRGKHSHQGVLDRGWIRKGACNTLPQNHKAGEGRKSTGTQGKQPRGTKQN